MVVPVLVAKWEAESEGIVGRRGGKLGPDEGVGAAEKGGRLRAATMEGAHSHGGPSITEHLVAIEHLLHMLPVEAHGSSSK